MKLEKNKQTINYFLYLPLFFFLDLMSFTYFEKPVVYTQLGFFILYSSDRISSFSTVLSIILMLITNFFYQGRVIFAVAYLLPVTIVLIKAHRYLDSHPVVQYVLTLLGLLLFCMVQSLVVHATTMVTSYTFLPIPVTLIIMLIFSFLEKIKGKQGNR